MTSKWELVLREAYKKYPVNRCYRDFLMRLDYKERCAVVLANMNYQVQNGGWIQWYDNRYVDGIDFLRVALTDLDTHTGRELLAMLNKVFDTCRRYMDGYSPEDDRALVEELNEYDARYYELDDKLEAEVETWLAKE